MRDLTVDLWMKRLNRAATLMADRLDDPPSLDELASAAAVSPFHFHRIWRGLTGETVAQTRTRLRLEAARGLLDQKASVTAAAMATGFSSSQSFARAFRRANGVTPSSYRAGAALPPETPDDAVVDIVWRDRTVLVALRAEGRAYVQLNDLFRQVWDWAGREQLLPALQGLYGLPLDDPESVPVEQLRYEAGLDLGVEQAAPPFISVVLPAGRYARLIRRGSYDRLQADTQTLVGAWLPASREEPADFPVVHQFINDPEETAEADLETHVLLLLAA